jgi:hypothetical protein
MRGLTRLRRLLARARFEQRIINDPEGTCSLREHGMTEVGAVFPLQVELPAVAVKEGAKQAKGVAAGRRLQASARSGTPNCPALGPSCPPRSVTQKRVLADYRQLAELGQVSRARSTATGRSNDPGWAAGYHGGTDSEHRAELLLQCGSCRREGPAERDQDPVLVAADSFRLF